MITTTRRLFQPANYEPKNEPKSPEDLPSSIVPCIWLHCCLPTGSLKQVSMALTCTVVLLILSTIYCYSNKFCAKHAMRSGRKQKDYLYLLLVCAELLYAIVTDVQVVPTALTIAASSPLLCQYFFTPYLFASRGQKFCNRTHHKSCIGRRGYSPWIKLCFLCHAARKAEEMPCLFH